MIELRFLMRGGEMVLQYRKFNDRQSWEWSDWQDVPVVEEGGE